MSNKEERKAPVLRFKGFTDDWEQRKFTELGKLYYGKSAPKWSVVEKGGTPCIRYGELYTKYSSKIDNVYSHTSIDKSKLKFSTGNELLIPRVGEEPLDFAKHTSWLSIPNVAIGEMITVLKTKENPLFLANYLRAKYVFKFARLVEGGNVSNLYFERYEDTNILIPSKNEQQNISKLILKIDKLITLQQRKLEQLELLQKSILQTIFTSNNKKEKIELNKLANYRRGSFPQPYTNKKWYGGKNSKPFVQVIDVNDNLKLHEQTKERISEIAQPKSVFVPKGSIIVTLQGSIGRVAITQYDSYVDRTLLILTDFKKKIDKYYFANALKMVFNKEKLKAPGGTIKTITKSTLSSFKIVLPNIKLQIQYGKLLKSVDKQFILNKNRIMKLKKIKQFLLQNIFI
jgi:type I restriction enzyme S subunit